MHMDLGVAMLRYEPIRGSHAVQEAVFFIQFAPEINRAAFVNISAGSADIEAILPNKSDIRMLQFNGNEDGSSSFIEGVCGIEFVLKNEEGQPVWVMRFSSDSVSVHCAAYTRYDDVWAQARNLLLKALALVPTGHAISGVGMRYIDRFRYNPDAGHYDLADLFRTENRYVTPRCFDAGIRWHCHNGWFAPVKGMDPARGFQAECLNQLNLASAEEVTPAGSSVMLTIDHNLTVQPNQLGEFNVSEREHEWLDDLMLALHKDNKRTMAQLLTDTVCKRLNLVPDEKG